MAKSVIKLFEAPQEPAPWIGRNIIQGAKDRQRKAKAVKTNAK